MIVLLTAIIFTFSLIASLTLSFTFFHFNLALQLVVFYFSAAIWLTSALTSKVLFQLLDTHGLSYLAFATGIVSAEYACRDNLLQKLNI
jgi:hypothetical protein